MLFADDAFLFFTSTAAEAAEKYLVLLHILNKRFELFLWLHIDLLFKKILLNFKDVDILLVPLFNSNFNSCRSPSKFFDAVRLNSVGIYSNTAPYDKFINTGIDGLLVGDNYSDWSDAINTLLEDENTRKLILQKSKERVKALGLS